MNANITGLLTARSGRKKLDGLIVTDKGRFLSDREARAYLRWCQENGYEDFYAAPEFEEIQDKLNL